MDKIKVLLLSIHYPLTMSKYFERALRRRDDIDLLTTGPYTSTWIPWMGGMNLPAKYAIPPDLPLPFSPSIGEVNYELVQAQLPKDWHPDIVLTVDAGIHWKYKPNEGLVAHIGTDPHVLNYDYQRSISDKFFNMQKFYSQPNDLYLPYAYDPKVHYPDDSVSKDTDAVLIGMPYENRVQWVNALRAKGVSVLFENGPIFDEYRELNNRARIGLNWSSMNDLNARAFELAAMKLCPVMNSVPDLFNFEFAEHTRAFINLNGAIEEAMWAVENKDLALMNAENSYKVVQPHTYDNRIKQLLKECGF